MTDAEKMARERVARGVELLDRITPDWRLEVDPGLLAMSSCDHCIVGQVYRGYNAGMEVLDLGDEDAVAHGFEHDHLVDYWDLEAEWHKELNA